MIKVEHPGVGNVTRTQLRDIPEAGGLYFTMLNGNKRPPRLNTITPEGKPIMEKLIRGNPTSWFGNLAPASWTAWALSVGAHHSQRPLLSMKELLHDESLRAIGKDLSRRVIDAGLLAVDPKRYLED